MVSLSRLWGLHVVVLGVVVGAPAVRSGVVDLFPAGSHCGCSLGFLPSGGLVCFPFLFLPVSGLLLLFLSVAVAAAWLGPGSVVGPGTRARLARARLPALAHLALLAADGAGGVPDCFVWFQVGGCYCCSPPASAAVADRLLLLSAPISGGGATRAVGGPRSPILPLSLMPSFGP